MAQKLLDSADAPAQVFGQQEVSQVDSQQVGHQIAGFPVAVFDEELGGLDADGVKQKKEERPLWAVEGGEIGGEQGVEQKVHQLVDVGDGQRGVVFGQGHEEEQRGGDEGKDPDRSPQEGQPVKLFRAGKGDRQTGDQSHWEKGTCAFGGRGEPSPGGKGNEKGGGTQRQPQQPQPPPQGPIKKMAVFHLGEPSTFLRVCHYLFRGP